MNIWILPGPDQGEFIAPARADLSFKELAEFVSDWIKPHRSD